MSDTTFAYLWRHTEYSWPFVTIRAGGELSCSWRREEGRQRSPSSPRLCPCGDLAGFSARSPTLEYFAVRIHQLCDCILDLLGSACQPAPGAPFLTRRPESPALPRLPAASIQANAQPSMVAPTLTDAQRSVLTAICDAAFRDDGDEALQEMLDVVPEPTDEQRANCQFFHTASLNCSGADIYPGTPVRVMSRTKFSDFPGSIDALVDQLSASVSKENLDKIYMTLSLLSTRPGTLLLTGHATPFPELTVEQREAVLQIWKASKLALLRSIYRGIVGAFCLPRHGTRGTDH